ncbi:MAG: T9SS type A sorting domain-containing protein [Gemmatimonadaceae bacterium]|nr:T9SS type A sorting domain-containing protein [Gemmatimonadaceae bacterium]
MDTGFLKVSLGLALSGWLLVLPAKAEPLIEGRVGLPSGAPAPGARVMLFDLSEFRLLAGTTADAAGRFSISRVALGPSALPDQFSLGQNYPNPFNPSTIIPYQLPLAAHVRLQVFNLLGQRIATLVEGEQPAGFHSARWNGTDDSGRAVGSGVYLYRLQSGSRVATERMVLVDGQAGMAAPRTGGSPGPGPEAPGEGTYVHGLTVSGPGWLTYVDPAFRVATGMGPVDLVLEEAGHIPREKVAQSGVPGDVDNNGRVDLVDALLVATYIADNSVTMPNNGDISQADMNSDGRIDYVDVWLIATQFVLQQIGGQDGFDGGPSRMYWLDRGTDRIQRSNLDGSNVESLVTAGLSGPKELALDVAGGKMYWTDNGTDKIQRANLDGSQVEDLVTVGLIGPAALELDAAAGRMYWTDQRTGKIQRANLDGSGVEDLVTGLTDPQGLALDVAAGRMYWTDQGAKVIQRANLDGSEIQDLVTSGLRAPTALVLDTANGKMYWTDWGTDRIQRADLDGTNVEDLVSTRGDILHGLALDLAAGKMYWTDHGRGRIQRANLDGSNVEDLVTAGLSGPSGLALEIAGAETPAATLSPDPSSVDFLDDGTWHAFTVRADGPVEVVANPAGTTPRVEITRTGGDSNRCPAVAQDGITREDNDTIYLAGCSAGQARVELRSASDQTLLRTYTFAIEELPRATTGLGIATIYWTDGDKIQRADAGGGNVEDLVTFGSPRSLALDVLEGRIYWTDQDTRWIWRANLDGSDAEAIVTARLIRPVAIALDLARDQIYWTDAGSNRIQRANLDGSRVQTLVSVGLHSPEGIALDADRGKVYWSDYGTNKIQRANLDGSQVEDLVTSGLKIPGELALDLASGRIYWTDYGTDKIQRADLDGSNVEDLVTTGLRIAKGLALDVASGKVYWADTGTGKVQRANLDGSEVEDVVTLPGGTPASVALASPIASLSPSLAAVGLHRSGTWRRFEIQSTEPVVVVANPTGTLPRVLVARTRGASECPAQSEAALARHSGQDVYLAACGPGEARVELRRVSDRAVLRTYTFGIPDKTRMYWTNAGSRDRIQRADIDGSNVQDLVTSGLRDPIDVALDLIKGKIYWTDQGTDKIQRANLDGSSVEDLITTLDYPVGIALDLAGGKMYWTDMITDKIQRASLDGSDIEDLISTGLSRPRGLALDLGKGRMYWVDQGTDKIQRANLDGSRVQDLVTTGLEAPDRLALDVEGRKMYWTEAALGKIQRANLDGSDVEDLVTTLGEPRGIALDLAGGRMYWTDNTTDRIQSADLDGSNVRDLVLGVIGPTAIALE